MTPDEYCQQKAAGSGSSFYYSFLFLPPERRRAITAVYAYCREVDDVVDEVSDATAAEATLAWWRTEIAQLFDGHPTHPVTRALQPFIGGELGISEQRLSAVLDGMQVDLRQNRFLDYSALQRYAHLVAGVVGEMSAGIFGYRDPQTLQYAARLGLALWNAGRNLEDRPPRSDQQLRDRRHPRRDFAQRRARKRRPRAVDRRR